MYLSLGSNLGNRAANIALALKLLAPEVRIEAVSPLYESAPADGSGQPRYYNAAARVSTELSPKALLSRAKAIERAIGRRPAERWAPRPIDIDIALYGDLVLETPDLTIPHPRLSERAFVLRPLLDLDPELRHPATGVKLADLPAAQGQLVVVAAGEWWLRAAGIGLPPAP